MIDDQLCVKVTVRNKKAFKIMKLSVEGLWIEMFFFTLHFLTAKTARKNAIFVQYLAFF